MSHTPLAKSCLAMSLLASSLFAMAAPASLQADSIIGKVVRFRNAHIIVDVTIDQDNPTVRDLLARLPLTLNLEAFAGREKIAYLPHKLNVSGSPGADPQDGDLIYFAPWGNLGFYYNTAGIGFSQHTIHIGRYRATLPQLRQLAALPVSVTLRR
jgi:hypothetical protein